MKPLKVALLVKDRPVARKRDDRNMGWWSYAVDQFQWQHFNLGKGFTASTRQWERGGFDLIWVEDGGNWGKFTAPKLPIVYHAIDSTLSYDHHFLPRLEQAKHSDLVLVDHDVLERFAPAGKPVHRLGYCVNDLVFRDYHLPKTVDVAFHCGGSPDRALIRQFLDGFCREHGLTFTSGIVSIPEYAYAMNRAKVVVNIPRVIGNRPHRVLDALACNAAVLTYPVPEVDGLQPNVHYTITDEQHFADDLLALLAMERWEKRARAGYAFVHGYHTWRVQAKELRTLLQEQLGI